MLANGLRVTLLISHIPKTAGTSLRELVRAHHPDALFVYEGQLTLGTRNLEFMLEFSKNTPPSVVMGHYGYGAHRLLAVEPRYVTILREPIARVVSLYHHQKALPDSRFATEFAAGLTLHDFVASNITEMTNNHMCRVIAGIPPDAGMLLNDRWLLDLALHNLRRHYLLVGRQEDFPTFVKALGALQGWPVAEVPSVNVAEKPAPDLDARTRAIIASRNALDLELYQACGVEDDIAAFTDRS